MVISTGKRRSLATALWKKRRVAAGLCSRCGGPRNRYKCLCDECRKIASQNEAKRQRELRQSNRE